MYDVDVCRCVWLGRVCVWLGRVCVWLRRVCVWLGSVCVSEVPHTPYTLYTIRRHWSLIITQFYTVHHHLIGRSKTFQEPLPPRDADFGSASVYIRWVRCPVLLISMC